jgi:hypothetical protein
MAALGKLPGRLALPSGKLAKDILGTAPPLPAGEEEKRKALGDPSTREFLKRLLVSTLEGASTGGYQQPAPQQFQQRSPRDEYWSGLSEDLGRAVAGQQFEDRGNAYARDARKFNEEGPERWASRKEIERQQERAAWEHEIWKQESTMFNDRYQQHIKEAQMSGQQPMMPDQFRDSLNPKPVVQPQLVELGDGRKVWSTPGQSGFTPVNPNAQAQAGLGGEDLIDVAKLYQSADPVKRFQAMKSETDAIYELLRDQSPTSDTSAIMKLARLWSPGVVTEQDFQKAANAQGGVLGSLWTSFERAKSGELTTEGRQGILQAAQSILEPAHKELRGYQERLTPTLGGHDPEAIYATTGRLQPYNAKVLYPDGSIRTHKTTGEQQVMKDGKWVKHGG